MPFLLLLAFPILEIYVAIQVGEQLGLLNAIVLLCGAALVGFGLLNLTGRSFLMELQIRAARGEPLEKVLLSQALRFFAGLLFIIPGFISDGMAIIALIVSLMPGLFAKPINRNVKRWSSSSVVFTRDVTPEDLDDPEVIDVLPEKPQSQD